MSTLDLEEFIGIYTDSILFHLEDKKMNPESRDFYPAIFEDVSTKTGFSIEQIKYLHHPFHWAVFSNRRANIKSFIPPIAGETFSLSPENHDGKSEIVAYIIKKYGSLLESRIRKMNGQEKN